jgi:hypothetical protein
MADLNEETIIELNSSIRELSGVMQSAMGITGSSMASQKSFGKNIGDASSSLSNLTTKNKEVAASTTMLNAANKAASETAYRVGEAFGTLASAASMGKDTLITFGKAMLTGADNFSKFGAAISEGSAALQTGFSALGPIGKLFGLLLKPLTMVIEATLGFGDNLFDAKDGLAQFGIAGRHSITDIRKMGEASGYSTQEIVKYTKMMSSAGLGLLNLGGNVNQGAVEFAKLTAITKEERMAFRTLGISMDQYVQNTADFVNIQAISGKQITERMKTDGSLQLAAKEYTKNLLLLSALSGDSVEEQRKKQLEIANQRETQIADLMTRREISRLSKGTEADKIEAARLQNRLDNETKLLRKFGAVTDSETRDALAYTIKTRTINENTIKAAQGLTISIPELLAALEAGEDMSTKYTEDFLKGADATIDNLGKGILLSKEFGDLLGFSNERLKKQTAYQDKNLSDVERQAKEDLTGNKLKNDGFEAARNDLSEAMISAKINFDKIIEGIATEVLPKIGDLAKTLAKLFDDFVKFDFKKVFDEIKETVKDFKPTFDKLKSDINGMIGDIKGAFTFLKDNIQTAAVALAALAATSLISAGASGGGAGVGILSRLGGMISTGAKRLGAAGALYGSYEAGHAVGEGINSGFEALFGNTIGSAAYDLKTAIFGDADADRQLENNADSLFNFGNDSGRKENFEKLNPNIKRSLLMAAQEFKESTGKKITINSAWRSEADQQRLWDSTNGTGKLPNGTPVARPGTSLHERGLAVDIQEYNNPVLNQILSKHGFKNGLTNDPQHYAQFPGARLGGSFSGPNSGYPVMLHGAETVVPTPNPSTSLIKIEGEAAANKITNALSGMNSDALNSIMQNLYSMMDDKLSEMIDKLSTGNDIQDKLLRAQM